MEIKYKNNVLTESIKEPTEYSNLSSSIDRTEAMHAEPINGIAVGVVTRSPSHSDDSRISVRWKNENGVVIFRDLLSTNGLQLHNGDDVILSKPGNFPEWIITDVLNRQNSVNFEQNISLQTNTAENEAIIVVDGERVEITGKDEIVLKCGDASLTLRRNGRVVIKGTHIESRSKGPNKIKGGSVQIN